MSEREPSKGPHQSSRADHPDVREVIPVFVSRLPGHVKRLRELLTAGDSRGLQRLAHQLRGAGESFGFEPITEYAATIEDALRAWQPVEKTGPAVEKLIAYIRHVEGYAGD